MMINKIIFTTIVYNFLPVLIGINPLAANAEQLMVYYGTDEIYCQFFHIDYDSIKLVKKNSIAVYLKTKIITKDRCEGAGSYYTHSILINCESSISKIMESSSYTSRDLKISENKYRTFDEATDELIDNVPTTDTRLINLDYFDKKMCPIIYNWLSDNKNATPILGEDNNKNKITKSIQLTQRNGVYYIPVELNKLISTNFVFDTGASDVSISKNLYGKMLELDLLDKTDILGFANYQIADGSVSKQLIINIKFLQIGGIKIRNVRASVSNVKDAPLLLGQSAISRIGSWKLNHKNNRLEFENSK